MCRNGSRPSTTTTGIDSGLSLNAKSEITSQNIVMNDGQRISKNELTAVSNDTDDESKLNLLKTKYEGNIKIGTLNINSIAALGKFEGLVTLINGNVDVLVITETKLDSTFPNSQFFIPGYKPPYRLDRNRHGGGVMVYVKNHIPSTQLNTFSFQYDDKHGPIESIYVELRIKERKWLLIGCYHPPSQNNAFFVNSLTNALDHFGKYAQFLIAGDLNMEEQKNCLSEFLTVAHGIKNI